MGLIYVLLYAACHESDARRHEIPVEPPSTTPTREAKADEARPREAPARDPKPSDAKTSDAKTTGDVRVPPSGWTRPIAPTDIRGDEVIPPGTSQLNAIAFRKLVVAKGDGAPVGGIGAGGIHLDELQVGHGWEKSRCSDLSTVFTIGTHDRVNVCMRVVHERGSTAELGVVWTRNGKQARRSKVSIGDMHALLTRAYLPISTGYEGEWRASIESVDGTVIGEVAFTVERAP